MRYRPTVALVVIAIYLAGCHYGAPAPSPPAFPEPTVPASQVNLSVSVSSATLKDAVQSAVPNPVSAVDPYNGSLDGGADNCKDQGINYGYSASRSDINVSPSGSTINFASTISYWAKGRARQPVYTPIFHKYVGCLPGLYYGSCGVGETEPTLDIGIAATLSGIDSNWSPQVNASLSKINAGNRCKVTIFNKDVTDNIVNAARDAINGELASVNSSIATKANLRPLVESGWNQMLKPVSLTAGAWLSLHPVSIGVFPLQGNSNGITAGVRLVANPTIDISADAPPADTTSLPPPGSPSPSNVFSVALPVRADLNYINAQLQQKLVGVRYPTTGWPYIKITGAQLAAYGRQVVLKVDGTDIGEALITDTVTVYFQGTPTYDPATNELSFPDLDYTLESSNLLANVVNWFGQDYFRDRLRRLAVVDLSKQIDSANEKLQSALNQTYGPISLSGTVASLNLLAVYTDPKANELKALFQTTGTLNAVLK